MGKDDILMLLIKYLIDFILFVEFDFYLVQDVEVNCKNGFGKKLLKF